MIKHKIWIKKIYRLGLDQNSRLNKLRLEKNERVSVFNNVLLKKFKHEIKSYHLNAYPETYTLYKELAKHHYLKKDNFLVTAGSDAGIRNCFDVFVFPHSEVVVMDPTFAMVDIYCKLYNAKTKKIKFNNKLEIKLDNFRETLNNKTTLIIIANPNSPTGTILNLAQIKRIIYAAELKKIPVLIDEAYFGFSKITAIKMIQKYKNLIVSRTFSKAYGIAGLRMGYLVAHPRLINLLRKFKPMYETNSLGILLAKILIRNKNISKLYISEAFKGKKFLLNFFKKKGINAIDSWANFILVEIKKNKKRILNDLDNIGILVGKSIKIKGMEDFIRITAAPIKDTKKIIPIFNKYY